MQINNSTMDESKALQMAAIIAAIAKQLPSSRTGASPPTATTRGSSPRVPSTSELTQPPMRRRSTEASSWSEGLQSSMGSFGPSNSGIILNGSSSTHSFGAYPHLQQQQDHYHQHHTNGHQPNSVFALPLANMPHLQALVDAETNLANQTNADKLKSKQRPSLLNRAPHDMTKYKTHMCNNMVRTGICEFGDLCVFAHSQAELRDEASNNSILRTFAFPTGVPLPPPPPPGMPTSVAFPIPPPFPVRNPTMPSLLPVPNPAPERFPFGERENSKVSGSPPTNELTSHLGLLPMGTNGQSAPLLPNIYSHFPTEFTDAVVVNKHDLPSPFNENGFQKPQQDTTNNINNDTRDRETAVPLSMEEFLEKELKKEHENHKNQNNELENVDDDEKFDSGDFKDLVMIVQGMAGQIIRLQSEVQELKSFLTANGCPLP